MLSNMTLAVGFKGGQKLNGYPMYDNNSGIRTLGGMMNANNVLDAEFGLAVYAPAASPDQFYVGKSSVTLTNPVFRGVLLGNSGIRENMPARADSYLTGGPATVVYFGVLWYDTLTRENGDAVVIGDNVCVEDATGILHTTATTAGSGFTLIDAKVVEIQGGSYAIQFRNN